MLRLLGCHGRRCQSCALLLAYDSGRSPRDTRMILISSRLPRKARSLYFNSASTSCRAYLTTSSDTKRRGKQVAERDAKPPLGAGLATKSGQAFLLQLEPSHHHSPLLQA